MSFINCEKFPSYNKHNMNKIHLFSFLPLNKSYKSKLYTTVVSLYTLYLDVHCMYVLDNVQLRIQTTVACPK